MRHPWQKECPAITQSIAIILLFGVIVLFTHLVEGLTGLGSTVLALPFGILLFGIEVAVPTLVILSLILCSYVLIVAYKDLVWKQYGIIILYVGMGVPFGIWLFSEVPEHALKKVLSLFMIFVSLHGLYHSYRKAKETKPLNKTLSRTVLFLGGCIHGAFSSGGPLVILYAAKALADKSQFRSTLCAVWVTLNLVMIAQFSVRGIITPEVLRLAIYYVPFIVVGAIIGNRLHHKVNEEAFRRMVYVILFLSGIVMMF